MEIYLDNNATTALSLPVLQKQILALKYTYGNPSDPYGLGVVAKREVEEARDRIADLIGANSNCDKLIFTGCASEANNAVFNSAIKKYPNKKHIVVSSVEHLSVLEVARNLEASGYEVTYVPVNQNGELDLSYFKNMLREDTLLVSIMTANNETGVIYPIDEIVQIVHSVSPDILTHTDAVQAIGKIPTDVKRSGVDFLSLSGHKFHAPKGVGALYIRAGVDFIPFIVGGHQESRQRAGTENTSSIIAMGEAAVYARESATNQEKIQQLRRDMESALSTLPVDSFIVGANSPRLSNTTSIAFANRSGYELMLKLAAMGICVSTGSACNSENESPSHVIKAMALPEKFQRPIRISLSNDTTQDEIDRFVGVLKSLLIKKGR